MGDLYLPTSAKMLHIFDQTMSMIPFAIKTDMYEAMKRADVKVGDVNSFLASLLAEHEYPGVSGMLRIAWTKYVSDKFQQDDEPSVRSAPRRESVRARAETPPPSPPADGGHGAADPADGSVGEGGPGK